MASGIMTCNYSGYLRKKGLKNPAFKRRFFMLQGTQLIYYKSELSSKKSGVIDLSTGRGVRDINQCSATVKWPVTATNLSFGISTAARTYYLIGESEEDVQKLKAEVIEIIKTHGHLDEDHSSDPTDAPSALNKTAKVAAKVTGVGCKVAKVVSKFVPGSGGDILNGVATGMEHIAGVVEKTIPSE